MKKNILLLLGSTLLFSACSTSSFTPKYLSEENDKYKVMYGKGTVKYQEELPREGVRSYETGYTDGCKNNKDLKMLKTDLIYNSNYYYRMGYDDGVLTCRSGKAARYYSN